VRANSYGYDGQGNRVSKTREDGTAEVYGYDSSLRLTRVDYGTAKTVEYSLDALGNRFQEVQTVRPATGLPVVTSFGATFNAFNQQLTRNRSGGGVPALNTTFAYDDIGNTLSESTAAPAATTTYSWDRDDRLRTVTPPAPGVPTTYSYDANGLRVQRIDDTGTTRDLLDGQGLLAELDGTNATTTRFLNDSQRIDDIISFEHIGATYYPLTDALGSWYAVADGSGAVARRFDFDVYGSRADLGGAGLALDVGFTGQRHDANGLMGIGVRPYMPRTGTWLEPDPAGMVDGPNLYAYVKNAPTMFTDPTGRNVAAAGAQIALGYWVYLAASATLLAYLMRIYFTIALTEDRHSFTTVAASGPRPANEDGEILTLDDAFTEAEIKGAFSDTYPSPPGDPGRFRRCWRSFLSCLVRNGFTASSIGSLCSGGDVTSLGSYPAARGCLEGFVNCMKTPLQPVQ